MHHKGFQNRQARPGYNQRRSAERGRRRDLDSDGVATSTQMIRRSTAGGPHWFPVHWFPVHWFLPSKRLLEQ